MTLPFEVKRIYPDYKSMTDLGKLFGVLSLQHALRGDRHAILSTGSSLPAGRRQLAPPSGASEKLESTMGRK